MIAWSDVWEFLPKIRVKLTVFLLIVSTFLLLGFLDFFTNHGPNNCEMTYMFEKPEYVEVALNKSVKTSFPRYSLYVYGEGRYARDLEMGKLDGIPVVFIPGNAGSYRQVRSLASVCLRKQYDKGLKSGFDFFTIDFDEEFSAFYGKLLYDQTRFLQQVVKSVLELYGGRRDGVVLIGHSMGGIVARALFGLPGFNPTNVRVIFTLATPHASPVAVPDSLVAEFYREVEEVWREGCRSGDFSHVTVVSITGGFRDVQVWSGLGKPRGIPDDSFISTVSTSIPDVWVGTDHLCIVWCKQLVLALSRAIFDIADFGFKRISTDPSLTRQILNYHLKKRSGGKKFWSTSHPPEITMDKEAYWWELIKKRWSFTWEDFPKKTYVAVPLYDEKDYETLTVLVSNHKEKDWLFACKMLATQNSLKSCSNGINLSRFGRIVQGTLKRKTVDLNLKHLRVQNFTHAVVLHPGPQYHVTVFGDVYEKKSRVLEFWPNYWTSYLTPAVVISRTEPGALKYKVIFKSGFQNMCKAYHLIVDTLTCKGTDSSAAAHGWVEFGVPANADHVVEALRSEVGSEQRVRLKLQSAYNFSTGLPAYIAVILLTGFIGQVEALAKEGKCPSFHSACCSLKGLLFIVLPFRIISYLLMTPGVLDWVPETDVSILERENLDHMLLPLLLYCAAFPLVYILSTCSWLVVMACGSALHQLTLRVFTKLVRVKEPISELAVDGLTRFPAIAVILLLAIGHATSGGFALVLGLVYYYIKVFKFYEEFVESLVAKGVGAAVRTVRERLARSNNRGGDSRREDAEEVNNSQADNRRSSISVGSSQEPNEGVISRRRWTITSASRTTPEREEGVGDGGNTVQNELDIAEDNNPEIVNEEEENLADLINIRARFHFGVLMLWLWAVAVNVSSVLSWATRLRYSVRLDPDPSAMTGFLILLTAVIVWQPNVPHLNRSNFFISPKCLRILGIAMLLYASVSTYRLGPLLALCFIWLAMHERWSKPSQ
ncbi:unnamed protein product [Notodromas monacha]|uniref:GPI inositol-deacylase n=1 Tax=Notodromas monacha TaxID=399045 RepID=A0A7R9BE34_9CRUS|nr:unnamed protein product [Notodromas monacha]CAG0912972.1 unnamed protein product [Notodromas monacha]